jgi:hypothetical protein
MSSEHDKRSESGSAEAELDPWFVADDGRERSLFGYAVHHPVTGGKAWTLSTPIRCLDVERRRATTRSGQRYRLGRRVTWATLPTEEALVAWALLVGPLIGVLATDFLGATDPDLAARWLGTCKAARHLGVEPPPHDAAAVQAFEDTHAARYAEIVRRRWGS